MRYGLKPFQNGTPVSVGIGESTVKAILQTQILPDKTFFGFMRSNTPGLYFGYFRCNYEMSDGRWIDGLRPFGSRAFLLGAPNANFYFKVHDEAAEGLGFAKRKARFDLSLPSPLAPHENLPGGVSKNDLTDGLLDASRLNS